MSDALLQVDKLRVAYPQRSWIGSSDALLSELAWAVDQVTFSLNPGERLGVVGESGCGKSTLGRAVMRLLPSGSRVDGTVTFAGESVFEFSPQRLRQFRGEAIALVFQDPMTRLNPVMTIGNHCLETLRAHQPQLSKADAKAKAIETLAAVNIPAERWAQYPHEFSGGMRQRVAIALALLLEPRLIVADEPTTSLDVTVAAQILNELTRLCQERNMGLILISHDLAMVGEYCDRLAVMYKGNIVEMGSARAILRNPQHAYTQSLLNAALHIQKSPEADLTTASDTTQEQDTGNLATTSPNVSSSDQNASEPLVIPPLLRLTNLTQHFTLEQNFVAQILNRQQSHTIKAVDGINLEIQLGEILGLVGESGCGKSTLSRTILHLLRPTSGSVEFLGKDLTRLSARGLRRQRRQMQMIFQDPHACLNPMMTVGNIIADPLFVHQLADPSAAKQSVLAMLDRVGLTPTDSFYDRYPGDLSGGQQQRVAIARALITQPKLVICDEPVSMLDASVQTQVLNLMLDLKQEFDLTYLFITHDLWVARFLCDRIAVMQSGKIVELEETTTLFATPQHPYTQTLLAAAPLLELAS